MEYFTSISLFVLQTVCFIFMYQKNVEFLSFILILVMHIFLLFQYLSLSRNGNIISIVPFIIMGWDGKVPLDILFIISWGLLLTSISFLVNTYHRLQNMYTSVGKSVNLGDKKNYKIKNNLKKSIIFGTLFLWVLFCCETIKFSPISYSVRFLADAMEKSSNNLLLSTTYLSLITSSISVYLSNNFSNAMKIISSPV